MKRLVLLAFLQVLLSLGWVLFGAGGAVPDASQGAWLGVLCLATALTAGYAAGVGEGRRGFGAGAIYVVVFAGIQLLMAGLTLKANGGIRPGTDMPFLEVGMIHLVVAAFAYGVVALLDRRQVPAR